MSANNPDRKSRRGHSPKGFIEGLSRQLDYSTLIFANLLTLPHFSVSSAMNFPNAPGAIGVGSTPTARRWAFKFGSATPAMISVLSLSMIAAGVPVGTQMPYQGCEQMSIYFRIARPPEAQSLPLISRNVGMVPPGSSMTRLHEFHVRVEGSTMSPVGT